MIARVWSAQMAPEQAPAYADHLKNHVLPALTRVDGYAGILYLERLIPEGVEVQVTTFWQSLDAVRSFVGHDLEAAMVADEAAALLTEFDRRVRHFEVILKESQVDRIEAYESVTALVDKKTITGARFTYRAEGDRYEVSGTPAATGGSFARIGGTSTTSRRARRRTP